MKIVFLGTRGHIDAKTNRHQKQICLKMSYFNRDIIIDCGEDWSDEVVEWRADGMKIIIR